MCLAIPAKVLKIKGDSAIVEVRGVKREINILLCPEVKIGDYVIVHAGFALKIIDKKYAQETIKIFDEIETLNRKPRKP
ncbi:MAG: HypC/HybG/HupF family hydrogenase formation chaperone [candidate division WOR-3 bacterium]|nr:HypC/HybG/HupF family hydrogenase formation chaperone [candidate division WOR-3 bacterium]MCX7756831.1 HypC/HybG/HupF family hydrogenase formation chaperone [candidate division WOR-3 bacterium]MDW7987520.1 HypC/HybG/HupF family hydrogenase formation chaperone [candidate division WOR-3 bacterium]